MSRRCLMLKNLAKLWSGHVRDLKKQAGGPITNPIVISYTHELVVNVLESNPQYQILFEQSIRVGGINIDLVTGTIKSF